MDISTSSGWTRREWVRRHYRGEARRGPVGDSTKSHGGRTTDEISAYDEKTSRQWGRIITGSIPFQAKNIRTRHSSRVRGDRRSVVEPSHGRDLQRWRRRSILDARSCLSGDRDRHAYNEKRHATHSGSPGKLLSQSLETTCSGGVGETNDTRRISAVSRSKTSWGQELHRGEGVWGSAPRAKTTKRTSHRHEVDSYLEDERGRRSKSEGSSYLERLSGSGIRT